MNQVNLSGLNIFQIEAVLSCLLIISVKRRPSNSFIYTCAKEQKNGRSIFLKTSSGEMIRIREHPTCTNEIQNYLEIGVFQNSQQYEMFIPIFLCHKLVTRPFPTTPNQSVCLILWVSQLSLGWFYFSKLYFFCAQVNR